MQINPFSQLSTLLNTALASKTISSISNPAPALNVTPTSSAAPATNVNVQPAYSVAPTGDLTVDVMSQIISPFYAFEDTLQSVLFGGKLGILISNKLDETTMGKLKVGIEPPEATATAHGGKGGKAVAHSVSTEGKREVTGTYLDYVLPNYVVPEAHAEAEADGDTRAVAHAIGWNSKAVSEGKALQGSQLDIVA